MNGIMGPNAAPRARNALAKPAHSLSPLLLHSFQARDRVFAQVFRKKSILDSFLRFVILAGRAEAPRESTLQNAQQDVACDEACLH